MIESAIGAAERLIDRFDGSDGMLRDDFEHFTRMHKL